MAFKYHPLVIAMMLSAAPWSAMAADNVAKTNGEPIAEATPLVKQTSAMVQPTTSNALPTIVVSAYPLNRHTSDSTTAVNVVTQDQLMSGSSTLGNALDGQVGVRADTFGGGASRPVIRGQSAPRVKVLSDGAEVMDASDVSPDHAVTVDPLLASKIEVLRGASSLLYGGGAIGGVVNVLDNKIPSRMPDNGMEGELSLRANTVADETAVAAGVTVGLGDQFALRVEGMKRDANNYRYYGGDESRVDGTFAKGQTGSIGFSWIGENGFAGLSLTQRNDEYGLPGHSHAYEACHPHGTHLHCATHEEHAHEEEDEHDHEEEHAHEEEHGHDEDHDHDHDHDVVPWIKLDSQRVDFRAEYNNPLQGVEKVKVRAGYTEYQHDEIEEGSISTSFKNKGYDARVELTHAPVAGLNGVVGVQYSHTDFSADGEEAFMPRAVTESMSAFFVESYQWNDVRLELGARQEWQTIEPSTTVAKFSTQDYDASATSVSAGATWQFMPDYSASLSLSHAERLPNAQELYANGGHFATNTYEMGDANLDTEKSNNIELNLRKTAGDATFALSLYRNEIDNYIYAKTLDKFEDFSLIQYSQQDATFQGAEAELSYQFDTANKGTVFADDVRAEFDSSLNGNANLPRIPSTRVGVRLKSTWEDISAGVEYYHVLKQTQIADFETETPAYDMLNFNVGYHGMLQGRLDYKAYLQLNNVLDETYYNHNSFLSTVPQMGRNLTAGIKFKF